MDLIETKEFRLIAVSYERSGSADIYRDVVENPLDVIENAMAADGWNSIDSAWASTARAFERTGSESGKERVSVAIMP